MNTNLGYLAWLLISPHLGVETAASSCGAWRCSIKACRIDTLSRSPENANAAVQKSTKSRGWKRLRCEDRSATVSPPRRLAHSGASLRGTTGRPWGSAPLTVFLSAITQRPPVVSATRRRPDVGPACHLSPGFGASGPSTLGSTGSSRCCRVPGQTERRRGSRLKNFLPVPVSILKTDSDRGRAALILGEGLIRRQSIVNTGALSTP